MTRNKTTTRPEPGKQTHPQSAVAASVVGVDVDSKTIQHARARYASQDNGGGDARLKFVQAS